MSQTDYSWGTTWDDQITELSVAHRENAELRAHVAELEAEVERLVTGLCHATLHDGRGGRVGLPILWRSWLGPTT
jgi:hypothetical protein